MFKQMLTSLAWRAQRYLKQQMIATGIPQRYSKMTQQHTLQKRQIFQTSFKM